MAIEHLVRLEVEDEGGVLGAGLGQRWDNNEGRLMRR